MAAVGICSCTLVANADALPAGDETLCPPGLTIAAENMSMSAMDARSQPSTGRKRSWLPTGTSVLAGVKRRKEHLSRFLTRPASDSTMDADVNVPAV